MGFARYSKQSLQAVRSQLRQLETRHDIIVKTSELCLEYTLCEPASEEAVQESLERLARGRTTIIIAHRLSTIKHADEIATVEHGRVVERGTHEQLLARGGTYARYYRMQFEGARAHELD